MADAEAICEAVTRANMRFVPTKTPEQQSGPNPLDRVVYRRRNLIARLFCRLKNWRRLATRYDRLARNYLAALALVAVVTEWNLNESST
jgi:transposase